MIYLLKVSVAWTLFLLLFETFYKSSGKFSINRFYLLFAIAAGLLLPLISLPLNAPKVVSHVISNTQAFYPTTTLKAQLEVPQTSIATAVASASTNSLDPWLILRIVYGVGVAFLALKSLLELGRITRLILRHPYQIVAGHKVIVTGKSHAPYSFMGWIFIDDLQAYQPAELAYIIRHEAAHNGKKHWLDLLLLQLACIVLWFHPLVWRYRYLLQLQHEYEADALAAHDDTYAYGHFLLQQTLLNGVPSIAHSFHFSPIKNRIKMLTKRQNQKGGAWKYFLAIPALLACTFLIAKAASNEENTVQAKITTYKDNTLAWRGTDTSFYDKQRKQAVPMPMNPKFPWLQIRSQRQIISAMNGEPVYQNEYLKTPASYGTADMDYADYLQKEFSALSKNTADSLTVIDVSNVLVNKDGKVAYYEFQYHDVMHDKDGQVMYYDAQNRRAYYQEPEKDRDPAREEKLNSIIDKIVTEGAKWQPAMVNGQAVNSFVSIGREGC